MGRVSAFAGIVLYMWDLCMKGQDVIWIDPIR